MGQTTHHSLQGLTEDQLHILSASAPEHAGISITFEAFVDSGSLDRETYLPPGYHGMVADVVGRGLTSRALFSYFF